MIRQANETDKEQILKLYKSLIGTEQCYWTDEYPTEVDIDYDLSRDALFVSTDEENRVYAAISIDQDENVECLGCWNENLKPAAELSRLAVSVEMQGRGIAQNMMESMFEVLRLRGYKSVHLLVNENNKKAINAYKHFDYEIVGQNNMWGQNFLCYERKL